PRAHRVGGGFISLYTLAFMSTSLLFLPPLLVTLPLKINALVGMNSPSVRTGLCSRRGEPIRL
ncbi:MAG TPA: MFS transporter, partial [Candidatus Dormibacteraeota bacterium]